MKIGYFFDTPSSFEGQPWAFFRNALGHAIVVGLLSVYLVPFWVIMVGYAVWEFLQWRFRKAEVWDCVEDWAYVCSGALISISPVVLLPMSAYLLSGVLRRKQ